VENSLKCLPVWIAGCDQMIALMGKSYPTRLWCLLELFTYDMMGGSAECITLLPLQEAWPQTVLQEASGATGNDCRPSVAKDVDVREAMCGSPRDKELLLSIIEAGVGVEPFNLWFNTRIWKLNKPLLPRTETRTIPRTLLDMYMA
jgi:hypothetical protein